MAYTYDDFIKAANTEGMMGSFSDDDLKIAQSYPEYGLSMLSLYKDAANATTEDAKLLAQEAMNQLRTNYSANSTQPTSSAYQDQIKELMGQVTGTGSFQYDNEAAYREVLNDLMNQQSFEYDYRTDPTYQALEKTYIREAQRTQQDVLAQVAAANGGNTPTSAVTAATQAGDYYKAQLTDRIPDLRQQAYQQYLNEASRKQGILDALDTDRQLDLQEHLNNQNILLQQLAALQGQEDTEYNRMLANYDKLMQLITSFGYEPTAQDLLDAGMTAEQAQLYKNYYTKSTKSSGSTVKQTSTGIDSKVLADLFETYEGGGDLASKLDMYGMSGQLTNDERTYLWNYFNSKEQQTQESTTPSFYETTTKYTPVLPGVG